MKKTLIMMCGLPASGKSTVARRIWRQLDHPAYFSLDNTREELFGTRKVQKLGKEVWQITMIKIIRAFREHDIVIYDATNITPARRLSVAQKLLEFIHEVDIFCVYMAIGTKTAKERNKQRNEEERVPDEIIDKMADEFIKPSFEEEHQGQQLFKEIYKIYPKTLDNSADIVYNILTKQIKEN